jgi:hypothetical protein
MAVLDNVLHPVVANAEIAIVSHRRVAEQGQGLQFTESLNLPDNGPAACTPEMRNTKAGL